MVTGGFTGQFLGLISFFSALIEIFFGSFWLTVFQTVKNFHGLPRNSSISRKLPSNFKIIIKGNNTVIKALNTLPIVCRALPSA